MNAKELAEILLKYPDYTPSFTVASDPWVKANEGRNGAWHTVIPGGHSISHETKVIRFYVYW